MIVSEISTRELVMRYAEAGCGEALAVLEHRTVIRVRAGNPCGEFAEHLVEHALGGSRAAVNTPHYDLTTASGERVQVRARHYKTRAPKHIKVAQQLDEQAYDELAVVMFRPDYTVEWAYLIPWEALRRLAKKTTNTPYRLLLPGKWRQDSAVRALTLD